MKRRLLSILLCLSMVVSVSGCKLAEAVKYVKESYEAEAKGTTASETAASTEESTKETTASASVEETLKETETETSADESSEEESSEEAETGTRETEEETKAPEAVRKEPEHLDTYVLSESYHYWGTENENSMSLAYEVLILPEEITEENPVLADTVEGYNAMIGNEYIDAFYQLSDMQEGGYQLFHDDRMTVLRADTVMISVLRKVQTYTGGAHGFQEVVGLNIDTETGKELALSDVVEDMDSFKAAVIKKLEEEHSDLDEMIFESADLPEAIDSYLQFYMTGLGMTVFFGEGTIAPYAAGIISASLTYEEAASLVKSRYLSAPADFILPMNSLLEVPEVDIEGTGSVPVSVLWDASDEYRYSYEVNVGGTLIPSTVTSYSCTSYLVKSDGRYYLYLFHSQDNGYTEFEMVDLQTKEIDPSLGYSVGEPFRVYLDDTYEEGASSDYEMKTAFLDPALMRIRRYAAGLSSLMIEEDFSVGADGMPVSIEDYGYSYSDRVLRSKQAFPCNTKAGAAEGPADTYYLIYGIGTDTKNFYVDLVAVDEEAVEVHEEYGYYNYIGDDSFSSSDIYRVYPVMESWPYTIDGVDESEYFDGILYAG